MTKEENRELRDRIFNLRKALAEISLLTLHKIQADQDNGIFRDWKDISRRALIQDEEESTTDARLNEIRELNKKPGAFSRIIEELLAEIDSLRDNGLEGKP